MKKDKALLPEALLDYYARVGAEVLNFKRAIIRKYKGHYYHERALIKVNSDGEIECTNKEYLPTAEEEAAIKAAIRSIEFPKAIQATVNGAEEYIRRMGMTGFLFVSRLNGGGVIMLQERRTLDDGNKIYIPHCLFSDGIWRTMEPDGRLPFWKPLVRRDRTKFMIHEGAKPAAFIDKLVNDNGADHPWKEELSKYEHWGAIGGALAPHRCDYAELVRERPTDVVYVCDNDYPGKTALHEVSRYYGHSLKGVLFDERWPESWDLADAMPKSMFVGKRFNGPTLRRMMQPATWATEVMAKEAGGGRVGYKLKKEFAEEWYHCIRPDVYVHKDYPDDILSMSEFNDRVRPYSNVDDVARLVKAEIATKSSVLIYSPAVETGMFMLNGLMNLNTHSPSLIRAEEGDVRPFLEFMEHLIPHEGDRIEMLRWCATLIARPDIKMLYGVLLVSETQGVGKGTLGEKILAPLVGEHNTSYPSENEIVDSNFNYWSAHKRLAVVHEIYAGHSAKAYNRLKSIVTDKYITVSKKYQANYEIENWIHIFACSNSTRAIQLSMDDRRWFVPKVTELKKAEKYWQDFNIWLTDHGGLGIIRNWAKHWSPMVLRGEVAPWSEAKREIVEDGYSTGMQLAARVLERLKSEMPDSLIVLVDVDLIQVIRDQIYEGRYNEKLERPATIRKVAKTSGWYVSNQKIRHSRWGQARYGGRIITNDPSVAETDLASLRTDPLDIRSLVQGWSM